MSRFRGRVWRRDSFYMFAVHDRCTWQISCIVLTFVYSLKKITLTLFHIWEKGIFCFELRESFISKNKFLSLASLPCPEMTSIVNHDESVSLVRFSFRFSGKYVHVGIADERLRMSSGGCFCEYKWYHKLDGDYD